MTVLHFVEANSELVLARLTGEEAETAVERFLANATSLTIARNYEFSPYGPSVIHTIFIGD